MPLGRPKVSNPKPGGRPTVQQTAGSGDPRRTAARRETYGPADGGVWRPAPNSRPTVQQTAGSGDPRRTAARRETYGPADGGVWRPAPNSRPAGDLRSSRRRGLGMVQNARHSGNSSAPLDGSGVLQRLLPAAERRNFIAWRREPQGRCRRERTTNSLDLSPQRGRPMNASRTRSRL